jgi:hypothetical protein
LSGNRKQTVNIWEEKRAPKMSARSIYTCFVLFVWLSFGKAI